MLRLADPASTTTATTDESDDGVEGARCPTLAATLMPSQRREGATAKDTRQSPRASFTSTTYLINTVGLEVKECKRWAEKLGVEDEGGQGCHDWKRGWGEGIGANECKCEVECV